MGAESLGFVRTRTQECQGVAASQTDGSPDDVPWGRRFVSLCKLPGHLGMRAAQSIAMTGIRFASLVVIVAASGCAVDSPPAPAYPQQMAWTGPPGGAIDEGYGYTEGEGSYEGAYPPDGDDPSATSEPSADPADPNYAFGDVTDVEIDATLEASGEWVEDEDYGLVWLPYTTVVGGDFTPYDSSGSWVYTDYGWSFQSDFDWGWLAFHFGRWTMFDDDRWGWVPDHTWGPSWCDWRHDGENNVVGWRPQAPDHRGGDGGRGGWRPPGGGHANIRDHRTHGQHKDPSWRFSKASELSRRSRTLQFSQVDGLRTTTPVTRPPPGQLGGRAASLMSARLKGRAWTQTHPTRATGAAGSRGFRSGELGQSTAGGRPWMQPRNPWNGAVRGGNQPRNEWRGNGRDWRPTQRDWRPQQRPTIDDGRGRTFGSRPEASGGSRMWPRSGDTYQGAVDSRGDRGSPSFGDRGGGSRDSGATQPTGDANGSRGWGDRSPGSRPSFDSNNGGRSSPGSRPSFDSNNGGRSSPGSRPSFDSNSGGRSSPGSRPSFDSNNGGRSSPGSRPSFDSNNGGRSSPGSRPSFDSNSGGRSSPGSRPSFDSNSGAGSRPSFGGGSRPSFSGGSSGGGRSVPSSSAGSSGGGSRSAPSSSSGSSRGSSSSSGSSSSGSSRSSGGGGGGGRHR